MSDMLYGGLQASINNMLHHAEDYSWTSQGFGFLRTYFDSDKKWRLNVWDSSYRVPNVSTVHDHPWDFESVIIAGALTNVKYEVREPASNWISGRWMEYSKIVTGEGGGPIEQPSIANLRTMAEQRYTPGESYSQKADDVHETFYLDGTITLNKRTPKSAESHARVFWPEGTDWVDAEPQTVDVKSQRFQMVRCHALKRLHDAMHS